MSKIKQLAVISGKGGAGKTTFSTNLAYYLKDSVIADCDVDAPDMEILLKPEVVETNSFKSGKTASIDKNKCTGCGLCFKHCKFDAIKLVDNYAEVNSFNCEGCGFCKVVCPDEAVSLELKTAGEYYSSKTKYGELSHARLIPGDDNSGKLVHIVRQQAKNTAGKDNNSRIIIDGPPGVGCAVMSALTGVDYAVIVTEPTVSGESDFKRVATLCSRQKIKCSLVINKAGINNEITQRIKDFAKELSVNFLGEIPFESGVVDSLINKEILIKDNPENPASVSMRSIFFEIEKMLN